MRFPFLAATILFSCIDSGAQTTILNLSHDLVTAGIASANMNPGQASLDSRPLLEAAMTYAAAHKITNVIADPGTYYFLSPHNSNTHVLINGASNVQLNFQSSDLEFAFSNVSAIQCTNCSSVTLENFTVDYLQLPFTQVTVTSVNAASQSFAYQTIPGYQDPAAFNANRAADGSDAIYMWVFRGGVPIQQVALAVVVLSGAGLMIKSMSRLLSVEPGLNPKNVLTFSMSVPQDEIYVGPPDLPRYCQDLSERAGAIPGVISVGAIAHLPFRGNAGRGFQIEGKPAAKPGSMPGASYSVACPGYFRTMGIPILRGREFTEQDGLGAPGAIVINEQMARTYWPTENPIGKAIRLGGASGPRLTIVGIAGDVRFQGLDSPTRRQFFRPYMQAGWPIMNVVVRTAAAPRTFAAPVKKAIAEALPELPVSDVTTMEDVLRDSTGGRRFPMLMLSVFSALALVLAAVGIIGVVGHSVAQRTQEIGVRMALGASSTDVLRLTLQGGMIWVLGGLAAGLAGTALMTRALARLLFGVTPLDPAVLGSVSLLLALVSLAATYIPARRAARIDPVIALRGE